MLDTDPEQECGYSYDHNIEVTYDDVDGWQGICMECGAELWETRTQDQNYLGV